MRNLKCLFGHRHLTPPRHSEHAGYFWLWYECLTCGVTFASPSPIATKAKRDRYATEARRQIAELGDRALAYPTNVSAAIASLESDTAKAPDARRREISERVRGRFAGGAR